MANIRIDLDYPINDGSTVVFRSPCDCTEITGIKIYYREANGNQSSKEFALADAHGENVGDIPHLFAENVVVKVILDVTSGMAFVQNADTNAYLEGRFEEMATKVAVCCVTPQMYGAKGDGATDDTEAIQLAIDSGVPVAIHQGVYMTTSPICIGSGVQLHSYGEIKYTGADYAVILDNASRSDVHFNKITADNGNGLKLHSHDSKMCAYNNVTVGEITAKGTGILTLAEYGNQYNEIRFTKINADICIDIQCSKGGWNTETKWYGGHMGGVTYNKHATYAIKVANADNNNITTHRFYNVGFEGVMDGCLLQNVDYFVFNFPRTSESVDNKVFVLKDEVSGCRFNLSYFPLHWLDYSEWASGANNIFTGIFLTDGGTPYTFSHFELRYGKMYNCNQKDLYYRNVNDETKNMLTLNTADYYESFAQELFIDCNIDCILDTKYYHSGNINTIYAYMSGNSEATAAIKDTDGKVIARVADYPWKKIRLTAVNYAFAALAPNGWIVEVLE